MAILLSVGFKRTGLLGVVGVGRRGVVEAMRDAVLVLDRRVFVLYANQPDLETLCFRLRLLESHVARDLDVVEVGCAKSVFFGESDVVDGFAVEGKLHKYRGEDIANRYDCGPDWEPQKWG